MRSMAQRGLRNGTARMPAPHRAPISPLSLRRATQPHAPRATPEGAPEPEKKSAFGEKVDKVIEELKKTGMTTSKAKEVLKTWSDIGVQDPEQLKKVLMKKSLAPIPAIAAQLLLDGVASYGGFYLGQLASDAENFPFRIGVEILGYFFGLYYFVQTLLDAGVIGGLLFTTYRYGTNSASLLTAIQAMAGPASGLAGLSIADRATQVVNILKVVAALEQVASILKEEYKETPKDNSLRNLGAYLTLAQAREKLGFKPETYGLSEKEAGNIAYAFATYDTNQNYKLEANELGALCESLGSSLSNDETKEALNILDVNKDGYISFNEFVAWWVKKAPSPPPEDRK